MRPFRKLDLEGYVLIDNRESPGLSPEDMISAGWNPLLGVLAGRGKKFESASLTCLHCDNIAIKNPLRTRERGHCPQCDHYICDPCAVDLRLTGVCRCREKRVAEHMQRVYLQSLFGPATAAPASGLILP